MPHLCGGAILAASKAVGSFARTLHRFRGNSCNRNCLGGMRALADLFRMGMRGRGQLPVLASDLAPFLPCGVSLHCCPHAVGKNGRGQQGEMLRPHTRGINLNSTPPGLQGAGASMCGARSLLCCPHTLCSGVPQGKSCKGGRLGRRVCLSKPPTQVHFNI